MAKAQTLDIWTLYRNPKDREKEWVVRLHRDEKPTDEFFEADTRDECKAYVDEHHPGAIWIPRMPADDPVIEGTWI